MKKYTCPSCNIEKVSCEFGEHKTKGRQYKCKECRRAYATRWYQQNRDLHKKRVAICNTRKVDELRQFKKDYLSKNPCVDCGENNPIVLDFDHVRGEKKFSIATILSKKISIKIVMEEIDKCQIRCANCHRIKTYIERSK